LWECLSKPASRTAFRICGVLASVGGVLNLDHGKGTAAFSLTPVQGSRLQAEGRKVFYEGSDMQRGIVPVAYAVTVMMRQTQPAEL